MKDFDRLILSLYTFFEDFKYLESCAHSVKRLFGPSTESVWETMRSKFIPSLDLEEEENFIQTSESTFQRQHATDMERFDTGYLQVWLYTMQHYPLMPPDPKRDDDLLAKPARAKADERAIYEMAELAHWLGFKSPEINALIDGSPDHQIARAALLQARKPSQFQYDARLFDILVSRIVDCFAAAVPNEPSMVNDILADSTMKPQVRCGMPQIRTHKQDSPLLFLDHVYADDVGVADTITSFFVCCCVFFTFFGKPAQLRPTDNNQTAESPRNISQSPLFVREDNSFGDHGSALHANLPRETPQQEQEEPPRQQARWDGGQQTLRPRHGPRRKREGGILRRRQTRKVERLRRQLRPTAEGYPEPMDLEWLNMEPSDQDMPDQGRDQDLSDLSNEDSQNQSMPTNSAMAEAAPHEQDSGDRPMEEGPHEDNGHEAPIDRQSQPQNSNASSIDSPDEQQQALDEYLDQLRWAQEEQERLEEELDRERLEEELGPFNQEEPVPELSPRSQEGQNSPPRPPLAPALVEISFWVFEQGEWKQSDCLKLDSSDPSPVEQMAKKYSWKNFSLYDRNLQSLSPAQCYRAAIADGNNAIFLISSHEEQSLAAEGRLTKDRQLLLSVSRALDQAAEPRSPTKHRRSRSISVLSEEL